MWEALEGINYRYNRQKGKGAKTKHLSERDDLSGLYNRRYLESRLQDNSKDNE
jgi:PleD family two-component response regulator